MKAPTSETKSANNRLRKVGTRRGRHKFDDVGVLKFFSDLSVTWPRLAVLVLCSLTTFTELGTSFHLALRLGIIHCLEIMRIGWTIAGNLDDHGVIICLREMIVASRFRVHAAGRKFLQRLRIEMSPVSQVPLARDDRSHPIVAVRVGLDRGMSGYEQQNRIEACFRRIANEYLRMNTRQSRAPNLIDVERTRPDFLWRDPHFGKGLSGDSGS